MNGKKAIPVMFGISSLILYQMLIFMALKSFIILKQIIYIFINIYFKIIKIAI